MTISASAVAAETRAIPRTASRNAAYDRARTCIILLVLLHHAILPYTYFGHTDLQSFMGFDAVAVFNDSYFMAAMFLLSGLFVWPSLQHKGIASFLRDRWWRLGFPFLVAAFVLMPIAYYAEAPRQPEIGFAAYWWKTITIGPWQSGPAWFIGVLLVFDLLAAMLYRVLPRLVEVLGELSLAGLRRPHLSLWALFIGSIVAYVPAEIYFGSTRWFTVGPFSIQASRVLLYLLYFLSGVGIGSVPYEQGLLARNGELARRWRVWLAVTVAAFGSMIALLYVKHDVLPDANQPPLWWNTVYALAFAFFSAAQTFNLLALFLKFGSDGWSLLDPLRENSYGIYLIHYVPMLWLQYALFDASLAPVMQETAMLKALIAFVLTLAASWAATAALRKIPGATRVL